jgi:LacI family transcriptional regulator
MHLPDPPTAIFAGNDLMALGAIYGLQEMGIRVPQDVAVMGYDNRELTGYVRPAISTVTMPCYEMGQAAARMILGLVRGETDHYPPVEVQGKLIVRESCGANPGKWQFEEEEAVQMYRSKRRNLFVSECE